MYVVLFLVKAPYFAFQGRIDLTHHRRCPLPCTMPEVDDLIKLYFAIGFSNKETLVILAQNHHIITNT